MKTIFTLAWRNIWRNPARSGVFIGAALLGFALALFTLNTMKAISSQRLSDAINIQTSDVQVHRRGFLDDREISFTVPDAERIMQTLRATPGVAVVSKRLVFNAVVASSENNVVGEIKGVVPADENRLTAMGDFLTEGKLLSETQNTPILISRKTADRLRIGLNARLVVTLKTATGELAGGLFRVAGIFATPSTPFDESTVIARYDDLQRLAGVTQPHEIAVKLADADQLTTVKANLLQRLPTTVQVDDWPVLLPELFAFDGFINMVGVLLTLIISLGLGFSLMNTMTMIIQERTHELGMLRAIGQGRWSVFGMLVTEGVLMMFVGAFGGVVLGALLVGLASHVGIPISAGLGMLGIRPVVYPILNPALLVVVLGLATALTLVIALFPASRIFRLSTAEALNE